MIPLLQGGGVLLRYRAYLESLAIKNLGFRVPNDVPLQPEVVGNMEKVDHNCEPLAFQVGLGNYFA